MTAISRGTPFIVVIVAQRDACAEVSVESDVGLWKLYYDGGCNLCHVSQLRAERWALRAKQPLDVDVLQGAEALAKGYDLRGIVVEADGQILVGVDAGFKIMSIGPWYVRWIPLLKRTKPTYALARRVYGLVAKYRYKWFGTRSCQIQSRK